MGETMDAREIATPVAELLFHIGSPCQNIPTFRISPFGGLIAAHLIK